MSTMEPTLHAEKLTAEQRVQVALALREARRLISEVGWTQRRGVLYGDDVVTPEGFHRRGQPLAYCSLGAITNQGAVPHIEDTGEGVLDRCPACLADRVLTDVVPDVELGGGELRRSLTLWNDVTTRTKEEVLALFDSTIAMLEGQP